MHIDFEFCHVVELDAVLFKQTARGIECTQVATAARIVLYGEAGINNRPVRAQTFGYLAEVVITRSVERREKAIVAIDTVRIGEIALLCEQH